MKDIIEKNEEVKFGSPISYKGTMFVAVVLVAHDQYVMSVIT